MNLYVWDNTGNFFEPEDDPDSNPFAYGGYCIVMIVGLNLYVCKLDEMSDVTRQLTSLFNR